MSDRFRRIFHLLVPERFRVAIKQRWNRLSRRPRFGNLRRLQPFSDAYGQDRGQVIDRAYIEAFLRRNATDIGGTVLEIGDDRYTREFGGGRVTRCEILHVRPGHPGATIVADLAHADAIPSTTFDCVILTQTLQYIQDPGEALRHLHRILRPGGVLLASVPFLCRLDDDLASDRWRFTVASMSHLLHTAFPQSSARVESHGNVLAASAMMMGLCCEDLSPSELQFDDPRFPVVITARVQRP